MIAHLRGGDVMRLVGALVLFVPSISKKEQASCPDSFRGSETVRLKKQFRTVSKATTLGLAFSVICLLVGCGGNAQPGRSMSNTTPANPPAPSVSGGTGVVLLVEQTPVFGFTVLSFSLTVTAAWLEPGDVPLLSQAVTIETNRLQVETGFLTNKSAPIGTYNNLQLNIANPSLTILNTSGGDIGSCKSGAICNYEPALSRSSISVTGPGFPVTGSFDVLLVDFDLANSIVDPSNINPVITVRASTDAKQVLQVKQIAGSVTYTGGDAIVDGATFDLATESGIIQGVVDFWAQYVDGTVCGFVFCTQGKIAEVDMGVPGQGTFWVARRVTLKPMAPPELEGIVVAVNGQSGFDMVVQHQVPSASGISIGDLVHLDFTSGATLEVTDTNSLQGFSFGKPADLTVGQIVTARISSAPSGAPPAASTDRVRLKSGVLTGRVQSITNANQFVLDGLAGDFPAKEIQVIGQTNAKLGDLVSVSGYLLNGTGTPVFSAETIRIR